MCNESLQISNESRRKKNKSSFNFHINLPMTPLIGAALPTTDQLKSRKNNNGGVILNPGGRYRRIIPHHHHNAEKTHADSK